MVKSLNPAPCVVVIDDDIERRARLMAHLGDLNYRVIALETLSALDGLLPGDELVALVLSQSALLPDVESAVARIRQVADAFICALSEPENVDALLKGGVDDLVLSPFPSVLVSRRIENIWQHPSREQQVSNALRDLTASLLRSLDLDEVLERVVALALQVFPVTSVNIMLIDDEGKAYISKQAGNAPVNYGEALQIPIDITDYVNLQTMRTQRQPLIIEDVSTYKEWVDIPETRWIKAYVGAPIVIDEQVIGFINLDNDQPYAYDAKQAWNLQAFADQIGVAVQNARLHQKATQYAEDLENRVNERTIELQVANDQLRQTILERQLAETTLDNERQLLRTLLDHLPDEVFIKDMDGNIITANRALMTNMGVETLAELGERSDWMLCTPDVVASLKECDRLAFAGESVTNREISIRYQCQNEARDMLVTRIPLKNKFGQVVGAVGINRDVTEIKRTEQRLNDVIERAYCLLWQATARVVIHKGKRETRWDMRVINEDAAQNFLQLQIKPGQPFAEAWDKAISDFDRIKRQSDAAILSNEESYKVEFRYQRADGEIRWLHEEVKINSVQEGLWELVGVSTDITERKQAEFNLQHANELLEQRVQERTVELSRSNEVLRDQIAERRRAEQSERRQRILAEALRDSALALSETLKLTEVLDRLLSSATRAMPAYDAASIDLIEDSVYVRTIRYHVSTDDGMQMRVEHQRYFLESLPIFYDVYQSKSPEIIADVHQDPRWVVLEHTQWVRSYVCVPITVAGRVLGFLSVSGTEVALFNDEHASALMGFSSQAGAVIQNARLFETTQRYAEDLRQRVAERTRELESERAQLRAILDSMTEGVMYFDSSETLHYVNPSLVAMTGYTEEEWLGGMDTWGALYAGDQDADTFRANMRAHLLRLGLWKAEAKIKRRNGAIIDASLVSALVHSRGQEMPGIVTVLRDISAEKRLEAQKARFIATASHELRTPITNMKTRLYLIKKKPELLDKHMQVLDAVTDRMSQLVDDLLDMSRFEHGVIQLSLQPVSLLDVVQSVVNIQRPEAEARQLTFLVKLPEVSVQLPMDRHRIEQVLTNLVTNAINYTPSGGFVSVSVAYEMRQNRQFAVIHVEDTGVGIPAHLVEDVFTPFFRVAEDNKGAGLGLSISREIMEMHGGEITVQSIVGQGTTFSVWLPMITEDENGVILTL